MVETLLMDVGKWQAYGFWYRHSQVRILPPQPRVTTRQLLSGGFFVSS